MKVLIVYDSLSSEKLTAKVAETIRGVLKEKGMEVDSFLVADVDKAIVKNYDCILVGGPTQWHRATASIMHFLDGFGKDEFSGKLVAAFDTQIQAPLSGNAAKGIEKKLEKLGFKIIMPSLVTYVHGGKDAEGKSKVQLKEGELEKAKKYAEDLANKLNETRES